MNKKLNQDKVDFFTAVEDAIAYDNNGGLVLTIGMFDLIADHIEILLNDSANAFHRNSNGTAIFLALTALEETAKAEMLIHRNVSQKPRHNRGRDPLHSHLKKQIIAGRHTIFMDRLPELIGEEAFDRLQSELENGDLITLREQALYSYIDKNGVTTPGTTINIDRAREILILALEVASHALPGWTEHAFEIGKRLEILTASLAEKDFPKTPPR